MGSETLESLLEFSCLSHNHFINMLNHANSAIIHAITYISMHIEYLGDHKWLKGALTTLCSLAIFPKQKI